MYYENSEEMLAERFHMDEKLLRALNPGVAFREPGTAIIVGTFEGHPVTGKVARIEADTARRQVRAFHRESERRRYTATPQW